MNKKILFCTCLTEYCEHIFNVALNMTKEGNAKLWIYHGLGRLNSSEEKAIEAIKEAEARVDEAYRDKLKKHGLNDYMINISEGNVATEICKLARDAKIDLIVMGTSTRAPMDVGESMNIGPLGSTTAGTLLRSPCPVLVVPPAMVPGLTRR
jgi:nucleotide-binding universal stress UspA family protein